MVCICSLLSHPIPLSPTQVAAKRLLDDRYKWKRPHAASRLGSVRAEALAQVQTLGNRQFLRKSVTTPQQQTLSMTHLQLFDNMKKKFSVRLQTQEGVHCGVVEISSKV